VTFFPLLRHDFPTCLAARSQNLRCDHCDHCNDPGSRSHQPTTPPIQRLRASYFCNCLGGGCSGCLGAASSPIEQLVIFHGFGTASFHEIFAAHQNTMTSRLSHCDVYVFIHIFAFTIVCQSFSLLTSKQIKTPRRLFFDLKEVGGTVAPSCSAPPRCPSFTWREENGNVQPLRSFLLTLVELLHLMGHGDLAS